MRAPSPGTLAAGLIGLSALALIAIGAPSSRKPPEPIATTSPPPAPSAVSAGGFTLTSASVDLPEDDATYPDGPHADVINANCTSCHSASMALTQPALSADQWKATVTKMREVYHAPVAEKDVAAIVTYLTAMPSQTAAPATGKAQDPDPKVAPDVSGGTG
jgi:cytochrome c5